MDFFVVVVDPDGFVIPSLGIEDSDQSKPNDSNIESSNSGAQVSQKNFFYEEDWIMHWLWMLQLFACYNICACFTVCVG